MKSLGFIVNRNTIFYTYDYILNFYDFRVKILVVEQLNFWQYTIEIVQVK